MRKLLITTMLSTLIFTGCGGGGSSEPTVPETFSVSGVAATGKMAPENSEVCLQTRDLVDISLGTLDTIIECTITDARGGFLIEDLQDKIDSIKDKLLILKVVINDPVKGIIELFSISHQTENNNRTANINEITDLETRIAINEATRGRITNPADCWQDPSCADELQTEDTRDGTFLNDITDGVATFLGNLMPEGSNPITDSYVADPQTDELDALQERVNFNYNPLNGSVEVTNIKGDKVAAASLDQLTQAELGGSADKVDDAEVLEAVNLAGGFGNQEDDGTARLTCWKVFRDTNNVLALTENTCSTSAAACQQAGGQAAETPHETAASCATGCLNNASAPFDIVLASSEVDGSNALYAQSTCLSTGSSFNPALTLAPLNEDQACDAGLLDACTLSSIITADSVEGTAPHTVKLDGTNSRGNINSWAWSSDDGQTASGVSAEFTYATEGDYLVTLLVTDMTGNSISSEQLIRIGQPEPEEFLNASFNGQSLDFYFDPFSSTIREGWIFQGYIFDDNNCIPGSGNCRVNTSLELRVPARTSGSYSGCGTYFAASFKENDNTANLVNWFTGTAPGVTCDVTYTTETITSEFNEDNRRTTADYSYQVVSDDGSGGLTPLNRLSGRFAFTWKEL